MPDGRWRPRPCPGEAGDRASAATFLTVDSGWREVCDKALGFVKRFVQPAKPG
jgi:hypothetical protein